MPWFGIQQSIYNEIHTTDIPITVNRVSGVAPLAIHFDAEPIAESLSVDTFHDVEYRWDFGDTVNPTATWDYGIRPGVNLKNEATGPVSAHVYEGAGNFTATVTVWDGESSYAIQQTVEIEVTDPDTVFADTTYVISGTGDFTDAPSGATQVTSSVFDTALDAALTAGARRILFKAGETFTFSSQTTVDVDSPVLIGSFGEGADPILSLDESYTGYFAVFATSDDIRFMDFEIDGNELTDPTPIRGMYLGGDNCLALRLY
ncbi:MAG: PKD domain-containing protein, partial [Spirochaetales bacterium]|nr:PKD domain-containing protein [Spirochaetales bacterium]